MYKLLLILLLTFEDISSCLPYTLLRAENGTLPNWSRDSDPDGVDGKEFVFVQITDPQFGLIPDSWAESRRDTVLPNYGFEKTSKLFYDGELWKKMVETVYGNQESLRLKEILKKVNALRPPPEFVVITGDLVDAFPVDRNLEKRAGQERSLREALNALSGTIPIVALPGNHDLGNAPTLESLKLYRDSFGEDFFSFWVKDTFFIVLNSQFYVNSSNVEDEKRRQDAWLDDALERSRAENPRHVILFLHVPPFLHDDDEDKDPYFNWEPKTRRAFLTKLREAGVRKIFAGHRHANAGGFAFDGALEVVVTTALSLQLGPDSPGATLVRVRLQDVEHRFYEIENFPDRVD